MMYEEDTNVPQVLGQVRLMDRFFEAIDVPPYREHHAALHCAYMDLLEAEIAPYALELAHAIIEWENRERERLGPVRD
jgi:hypothetical protein